jgi:hypothetical protein
MKYLFLFLCTLMQISNICAQTSIEEINSWLDTRPYFKLGFVSKSKIVIPDTIKGKILKALNKELPKHFADSVFTIPEKVLENITNIAWQKCKTDTACFEEEYKRMCDNFIEETKNNYFGKCYSINLILGCGNWDIKEAIPYLKEELQNKNCEYTYIEIEMALAKLGDDSIKQVLIERYTLKKLLTTTQENTNSNYANNIGWETYKLLDEGYTVAVYLKCKEILLNLLDLIYVKGKWNNNIAVTHIAASVVSDYAEYFRKYSNYYSLQKVCMNYARSIWRLEDNWDYEDKKLGKKEREELKILLSTEYRTKIRNQIQDWVVENVDFEE